MQRHFVNSSFKLTLLAAAIALSGCSVLDGEKVDYKTSTKAPSLAVPPDLTQLSKDTRYSVINGGVSAASSKASTSSQATKDPVALSAVSDVRVERQGNQRWLVIKRSPETLWAPLKDFWLESGFTLSQEDSNVGIMETEWNENRANIPQDFIRRSLGKVLDGLYSTSLRDKYRTRLESRADGGTEIFITHRGMQEVYATDDKNRTVWQARAADPELEAEFLRRLMLKLGASAAQTSQVASAAPAKPMANESMADGLPVLVLTDSFDRAWRRVGLSLDRTGFTVEDRDRNKGLYYVRYVSSGDQGADEGFFKKLFGGSAKPAAATKFQILVRSGGDKTTVSVLNDLGSAELSDTAQKIVKVLAEDLK
jgi:outer membrane protein assembly factor BamC